MANGEVMTLSRRAPLLSVAIAAVTIALSTVAARAQASETRAQLESYIVQNIGPNGVGAVTGAVLQRGLLNQAASTQTLLDPFPVPFIIAPPINTLTQGLEINQTLAGAPGADFFANPTTINFGAVANAGHNNWGFGPKCNFNSASYAGQAFCGYDYLAVNNIGTPGVPDDQYVGHFILAQFLANTTDNDASIFGLNSNVQVIGTGVHYAVGSELNVTAFNPILDTKNGLRIAQASFDAFQGTLDDAAIEMINQSGAVGWKNGIEIKSGALSAGGLAWNSPGATISDTGAGTLSNAIVGDPNGSTWVNTLLPGSLTGVPLKAISTTSRNYSAILSATKTSLNTTPSSSLLADTCLNYADNTTALNASLSWCRYSETVIASGSTYRSALGEENSIENLNANAGVEDPFTINPLQAAVNLRLDSGIGSGGFNLTAALDIVSNGGKYNSGLVIAQGALDTTSGYADAIALGVSEGISYYSAAGTRAARIFLNSTSPGTDAEQLIFGNSTVDLYMAAGADHALAITASNIGLGYNTTIGAGSAITSSGPGGAMTSAAYTSLGTNVAAFLSTPTSVNFAAALTDETGTGSAVFSTSPIFVTSATDPLLIGGSAVSSTLTLESTSASGSSDSIVFKTGAQVTALTLTTAQLAKFGVAGFTANGAVATAMSSIGPTGSHATIQEWLTVQDSAGTTRYIPAF